MNMIDSNPWIIPAAIVVLTACYYVRKTLRRIEHKVDRIALHLGLTDSQPSPSVIKFIENGDYSAAVKAYRRQTGVDATYAQEVLEPLWSKRLQNSVSKEM